MTAFPHCERFGFDAVKIQERLQWLELEPTDHDLAKRLHARLNGDAVPKIIDAFYGWLMTLEEAQHFLEDKGVIERLKITQGEYLLNLGVGFNQAAYFESRLRVGLAHAWVGLSLSLYLCAYRRLSQLIIDHICTPDSKSNSENVALLAFVHKIIALDMSLAVETYHGIQVQTLEETLDRSLSLEDSLRLQAGTDSLTGLFNHERIMAELVDSVAEATHGGYSCAVVMADIDFFKRINDTHGHLVGDKVLMEVAQRLRGALRDFDCLGRYGGEEFLLILKKASQATAHAVAERVRQHVCASPINLQGLAIDVTISLGVSLAKTGDETETVLSRADQALYRAKDGGRNRVELIL